LIFALRPQTPKHIRGGWSHYTDTSEPVEVMGLKIWSLSNPGLEPPTFRSLVQRANHCTNRAHRKRIKNTVGDGSGLEDVNYLNIEALNQLHDGKAFVLNEKQAFYQEQKS
jgi:hypothetical protein